MADTSSRSATLPERALYRVSDGLDLFARVIASIGLVGLIVLIVMQVLFRYLLDESLAWTEELSRYMFITTSFVAITIAHRRAMHAGYASLVSRLPPRVRRAVILAVDLAGLVFFAIVGLSSKNLLIIGADSTAPATGLPMVVPYLIFPVFAVLGVVFSLEHFVRHLSAPPDGLIANDDDRAAIEEAEAVMGASDFAAGPPSRKEQDR